MRSRPIEGWIPSFRLARISFLVLGTPSPDLWKERCIVSALRKTWIGLAVLCMVIGLVLALPWATPAQDNDPTRHSGIVITLKNKFIKDYKDRVTIDATYTVDKAHPHPNPPDKDGDLHIAGRAPEIELATVAEIMNAASQHDAVDRVHAVEGTGETVKITGAWRIWCEHGGTKPQVQGTPLKPFPTTNPPHVFEIHPITSFENKQLRRSLVPIVGFHTKDAHDAFVNYENLPSRISPSGETTTIVTQMAGYNYVEFILELNKDPTPLADGREAFGQVRDLEGELLVHDRRMVFAAGTEPEQMIKGAKKGKRLHVLGIPRIDLALVDWRVANAGKPEFKDREPLTWNLPYEMIIAAVYPDRVADD
jgi:hypothetical protein